MSNYRVIWKYQAILLLRNKWLVTGLLFLLVAGIYGARYGQHFVDQQRKVLYSVDTLAQRSEEQILTRLKAKDTATAGKEFPGSKYYRSSIAGSKTVIYAPSPFASLSVGQKDNYPFYHQVGGWSQDIYAVTTTDIQNPVKLLSGNFDLAFVFIYLFPLFIIALGYNVLAGEKESSTFTLLRVQSSVKKLVSHKLGFLTMIMVLLSVVLNLAAFSVNGISFSEQAPQMGAWIVISIGYILFWFSLVYLIVSLNQSGATTALLLGGLWIILLLLVPSIVHRNVSSSHEKEQVQGIFNRRGDFAKARDLAPKVLEDSFRKLKHPVPLPAMTDTGMIAEQFYKGIMASEIQTRSDNRMGRMVMNSQAKEYQRALALNWVNPVFAVQNAFNQVAETEINNFHNYLKAVENYQIKRRYFLYNYSFNGRDFRLADYYKVPGFDFRQPVIGVGGALGLVLPVLVLSFIFIIVGSFFKIDR